MQFSKKYLEEQRVLTNHERANRAWQFLIYIINTMCLKEGEPKTEIPFHARQRLLTGKNE